MTIRGVSGSNDEQALFLPLLFFSLRCRLDDVADLPLNSIAELIIKAAGPPACGFCFVTTGDLKPGGEPGGSRWAPPGAGIFACESRPGYSEFWRKEWPRSLSELQAGDHVLVQVEKPGRHFGMKVTETIVEQ